MSDNLTNCPVCGGLREDGVCDNVHPTNANERLEMGMKSWINQFYANKEQENK